MWQREHEGEATTSRSGTLFAEAIRVLILIVAEQAPVEACRYLSQCRSSNQVQQANALCSVLKGIPDRKPAIRQCMPPKLSIQIRSDPAPAAAVQDPV